MSTDITVRLSDGAVAFLDEAVARGEAPTRDAFVAVALEREMRRSLADRDAQTLLAEGPADDLDDLVEWTAAHAPLDE